MRFAFTLLLIVVATLLVATSFDGVVDARRIGKQSKKNAKLRKEKAAAAAAKKEAAAAKRHADKPTKLKTGFKDWSKVDWEAVDDEWVDDDELTPEQLLERGERDPDTGKRQPPPPKGKTHIVFGKLKGGKSAWTLEDSENMAVRVHSLLKTAAIDVTPYASDPANLIFIVNSGWATMAALFELALSLPDMDYLEFDNKSYYAEDRPDDEKDGDSSKWGSLDYLRTMADAPAGGMPGQMNNLPPGFDMSQLPPDVRAGMQAKGGKNKNQKKRKRKRRRRTGDDDDDAEAEAVEESPAVRELREKREREERDWDSLSEAEQKEITARRAREKRAGELAARFAAAGGQDGQSMQFKDL